MNSKVVTTAIDTDTARLAEWIGYLNAYISSVIPELQESLDKPLYIAFNHHVTEDLSRIKVEDYTTENKIGIKRWITVPGTEGMPKAFQDFTDMFAVDYNSIKDELEKQNGSFLFFLPTLSLF